VNSSRGRTLIDRLVSWSPVLLLGALAALTWWLDAQIRPPVARDGLPRHDPDLVVTNFRAASFDEKGHPAQRLDAREARHYPDDGSTAFVDPRLVLTESGSPRFTVSAAAGRVTGDRRHAHFEGRVRAVRDAEKGPDGKTTGPIVVTTEYLHVIPHEHRAESNRPVTVEDPRGIIRANRFAFDDRAKTIELRAGASGTIEPQAASK
jgi:lipopolysaccharide export system protein LptC